MATRDAIISYVEEKVDPIPGFVPIYEIVLFERLREWVTNDGKGSGLPDTSGFNNMGFYFELDDAIATMHENRCNIRETVFNYGFILVHWPGLYNNSSGDYERMFFEWDEEKQGFYEAEEPLWFEHLML